MKGLFTIEKTNFGRHVSTCKITVDDNGLTLYDYGYKTTKTFLYSQIEWVSCGLNWYHRFNKKGKKIYYNQCDFIFYYTSDRGIKHNFYKMVALNPFKGRLICKYINKRIEELQ